MSQTETMMKDIGSIEEFTVFALERSLEGVRQLREQCAQCADLLLRRDPRAVAEIAGLASNLRDFHVFESDIVNFFQIAPQGIRDVAGDLEETESNFQQCMNEMLNCLAHQDLQALRELLSHSLPEVLGRFEALLPSLREYIDAEYLQPMA